MINLKPLDNLDCTYFHDSSTNELVIYPKDKSQKDELILTLASIKLFNSKSINDTLDIVVKF